MSQPSTHNQQEFTVSEISGEIKRTVEGKFSYVRVRGEISGLSRPQSGHLYMSLKDEKSVLRTVCWKGVASRLAVQPEDGLEVIVTGKITTYAGSSNYQLTIDSMEVAGEGALMALLEKRKKELAAKGLFDPARKKAIPQFPQKIGVVTSPSGAVIRDILHRLGERFPCHVLVAPVKVQGKGAEDGIAAAIRGFNTMDEKPDVIIVARGGGSLEDLWCFNEEVVVLATAESEIPIISAVGHETDTTLIDYASDLRAPTPTGAAEFATPYTMADLRFTISEHGNRLTQTIGQLLERYSREIDGLKRGLPKLDEIVGNYTQRLDDWSERLNNALPSFVEKLRNRLTAITLRPQVLLKDVEIQSKQLAGLNERLQNAYNNKLMTNDQRLGTAVKLFESLNYKNVLKRGFALVKGADGKLVSGASAAQENMVIEFNDGEIEVTKNG